MNNEIKKELEQWRELLDFEPMFYIMDKGLCRMMLVKSEDKYEYKGAWIGRKYIDGVPPWEKDVYPACESKGHLQEYVTNYEFTKSRTEAFAFLDSVRDKIPMTTERMQNLNSNPDFIY